MTLNAISQEPSISTQTSIPRNIIIAAQLLSQMGDRLMLVLVIWGITLKSDPKMVSWFIAIGAVPHLLLSQFAPKIISKWGSLKTVIRLDYLRAVLMFAAVYFVPSQLENGVPVVLFFSLQFLINIFGSIFNPAILVLPTELSQDPDSRQKLTASIESCIYLSVILAPIFSLGLYSWIGLKGVMGINGALYLTAAFLEQKLQKVIQKSSAIETESKTQPAATFLSIHFRKPLLTYLLFGFMVLNLFLGPVLAFMPLYVRYIYQANLNQVGALEVSLGVGTLLGSVLVATVSRLFNSVHPIQMILTLIGIDCFAYLGFTIFGNLTAGLAFLFILGIVLSIANVKILSFLQQESLSTEISTLMSAVNVISVASLPLSMAGVGFLLEMLPSTKSSLQQVAISCSSLSLLCLFAFVLIPVIFKFPKNLKVGQP